MLKSVKIESKFRIKFGFESVRVYDLRTSKPKQVLFFFSSAKVLRESCGSSAEEFCYFDGPTLCISAMILIA